MRDAQQSNSVEQRRKLLKGALAASGVVSMGYSGSALASINCVEKVRTDVGFPGTDLQFREFAPDPLLGEQDWAWVKVEIRRFTVIFNGTLTEFAGFQPAIDPAVVDALAPVYTVPTAEWPMLLATDPSLSLIGSYDPPRYGWVLAYFDDTGAITGVFPTTNTFEEGFTPATDLCLASINPTLDRTNMSFGG